MPGQIGKDLLCQAAELSLHPAALAGQRACDGLWATDHRTTFFLPIIAAGQPLGPQAVWISQPQIALTHRQHVSIPLVPAAKRRPSVPVKSHSRPLLSDSNPPNAAPVGFSSGFALSTVLAKPPPTSAGNAEIVRLTRAVDKGCRCPGEIGLSPARRRQRY